MTVLVPEEGSGATPGAAPGTDADHTGMMTDETAGGTMAVQVIHRRHRKIADTFWASRLIDSQAVNQIWR